MIAFPRIWYNGSGCLDWYHIPAFVRTYCFMKTRFMFPRLAFATSSHWHTTTVLQATSHHQKCRLACTIFIGGTRHATWNSIALDTQLANCPRTTDKTLWDPRAARDFYSTMRPSIHGFYYSSPCTITRFDCITTFVDRFSKRAHFIPSRSTDTVVGVASCFFF